MQNCIDTLTKTPLFGITLTIFVYAFFVWLQKKLRSPLLNPLMWTVAAVISILLLCRIPLENYELGGDIIGMFLSPATAVLAVSIYNQLATLKKNLIPVVAGCLAGAVTSIGSVIVMSKLFGLDKAMQNALTPKSVTTPIAMAVSEQLGGIVPITVAAVVVTGIIGCVAAPLMIRVFFVKEPVAAGVAIGACSHALGTTKAIELSETHGAMSGIAIGLSGIITVLICLFLQ